MSKRDKYPRNNNPLIMDNNCVKNHPHPSYPWKIMVQKQIFAMYKLWLWPWRYHNESRSWYDCVINYQDPTWQWGVIGPDTDFQYVCTVTLTLEIWPWLKVMTHPWVMDNNYVQIQHSNEELWSGHRFSICMHCDLDIGDKTLCQGHDTTLGHGQ